MTPGQTETVVLKFKVKTESGKKYLYNNAEIGTMWKDTMLGNPISYRGDTDASLPGAQVDVNVLHNTNPSDMYLQNNIEQANANNVSQDQIDLPTYDLTINKTFEGGVVDWNETITYRLSFTNNGPARTNIEVSDVMYPVGMTLVDYVLSPGLLV
jgi:uncharacterized repeat protein (TIGR01451 family)